MNDKMDRRDFFRKTLALGALAAGSRIIGPASLSGQEKPIPYDLIAVRNGEPGQMFAKAIEAAGGMSAYVKKGQKVLVKPNIGWAREVENGANTHPELVKSVIEACYGAGAKEVFVFDHTCNNWRKCYEMSGIEKAAKDAGATVVSGEDESYYQDVEIKGASVLQKAKIHELVLDSDVFINIPVLKHHGSSKMTAAMKNLMGIVWDRGYFHARGLDECIAESSLYRKPDLNIIDAYRVTTANGPQRAKPEDIVIRKMLLMSKDIVAIDTAAERILFPDSTGNSKYIDFGVAKGLGTKDIDSLNIHRITV